MSKKVKGAWTCICLDKPETIIYSVLSCSARSCNENLHRPLCDTPTRSNPHKLGATQPPSAQTTERPTAIDLP